MKRMWVEIFGGWRLVPKINKRVAAAFTRAASPTLRGSKTERRTERGREKERGSECPTENEREKESKRLQYSPYLSRSRDGSAGIAVGDNTQSAPAAAA